MIYQIVTKQNHEPRATGEKCEKGVGNPFFACNHPPAGDKIAENRNFAGFCNSLIYLDSAATAPVCAAAAEAVSRALSEYGNPSSGHALGRRAAEALREHRAVIADRLGALPEELVFTSGGTEANNWAILAALESNRRVGKHIIATMTEHAAVREPIRALAQRGYEVTWLRPDQTGQIAPESLCAALRSDTALVSAMLVNNELGTILPVAAYANVLREAGSRALLHTDAVQGFLKVPFTPTELGVDLLTISGHKIGAPKGIGALYIRKGVTLPPLLRGGGQEGARRPGTESTPLIAGFAAAAARGAWAETVTPLRDDALAQFAQIPAFVPLVPPGAPHILAMTLPGCPGEAVARVLSDKHGICVSTGAACHRGKPSHVLAALGLPKPLTDGALRISFSPETKKSDIDALATALAGIAASMLRKGY